MNYFPLPEPIKLYSYQNPRSAWIRTQVVQLWLLRETATWSILGLISSQSALNLAITAGGDGLDQVGKIDLVQPKIKLGVIYAITPVCICITRPARGVLFPHISPLRSKGLICNISSERSEGDILIHIRCYSI
eukprot:sb/3474901/